MLNNLSAVHQRPGDPAEAISCAHRSLTLSRVLESNDGVVMSLANLGFAYWQRGRWRPTAKPSTVSHRTGRSPTR